MTAQLEADLQIAAVANDPTLVSANTRHYSGIPGLRVENWLV